MACAAPQSPIRVPSREPAPVAGEAHHRADRRDREGAVRDAEREDGGAERTGSERRSRSAAIADERQRRTRCNRRPSTAAASPDGPADHGGRERDADHADQHAAVLQAGELGRRSGRHAEDEAGEGLDEQFLQRCRRASRRR